MANFTDFMAVMLGIIADFLGSEPIVYLYGLVILLFLIEILRRLLRP